MTLPRAAERTEFDAFYRVEFPRVYRASFLATGDRETALDLTQEAFARAYSRWGRLGREDWAGGWVMTTALNLARRRFRRSREVGKAQVALPPPAAQEDRLDLVRALRTLPRRQRQALVLYYVGDHDAATVAHLMGVSEGTVKAHLAQGRAALRKELEAGDA